MPSVQLSPDTGPLHITVALDRPVVSLIGYSNPKRVGPYRRGLDLVVDAYGELGGNIISVLEVPREEVSSYGVIAPGEARGALTEVRGLVEKPKVAEAPSNLIISGRYILQPEVMRVLENQGKGAGGEIQLTDAMAQMIGQQPFHAVTFAGRRYDCGSKTGFVEATLALALERDEMADDVRAIARRLLGEG